MLCPVSLVDNRTPGPLDRSRIVREPTVVPLFLIVAVPPPPPPPSKTQPPLGQPYRFVPGAAVVRKNNSACVQVDGSTVPVLKGLVNVAA
jgi:hypothetical protein